MPNATRSVEYQLNVVDNLTPTTERAAAVQEGLDTQVQATTQSVVSQDIAFIKTVTSLSALRGGIMAVFHSFILLGNLSDAQTQKLLKMGAAMSLFVGGAQALKGVIGLSRQLRNAEIGLAAVETYRAVLKNPAALGLVAVAGGAAAGLAGYFIGKGSGDGGGGTTVQQSITFTGGMSANDQRAYTRDTLELMGG